MEVGVLFVIVGGVYSTIFFGTFSSVHNVGSAKRLKKASGWCDKKKGWQSLFCATSIFSKGMVRSKLFAIFSLLLVSVV